LEEAGIPREFATYSIRHATITKAYRLDGVGWKDVNIFTGHSELADTSSRFYLHLSDEWLGFKLAAAPVAPAPLIPLISQEGTKEPNNAKSDDDQPSSNSENASDEHTDHASNRHSARASSVSAPRPEKRRKKRRIGKQTKN
jgi:hypothetical protein